MVKVLTEDSKRSLGLDKELPTTWMGLLPMRSDAPPLIMARTNTAYEPLREELTPEEEAALSALTRPEDRHPAQQVIIR